MKTPNSAKRTGYRHSDGGFTLIELMMALLIVTVGLLGLLQSVNIAYEHNLARKLRDEALTVAEEQLYVMRRAQDLDHGFATFTTVTHPIGGANKEFRVSRETQAIGESSKKLTVAVRWSFKNRSSSHVIYTIRRM